MPLANRLRKVRLRTPPSDRLRKVLPQMISNFQGDFIMGRQILDQSLVANEAIEDYGSCNARMDL